jgi:hypothetical protein
MDPFSIAVGVGGLLALTAQLVEIGSKYGKSSPKEQGHDLIFELRALADVLKQLKGFLEGPDAPPAFNHMSTFLSTNTGCEVKMKELLRKLQKTVQEENKIRRAVDRILWPLKDKEHREAVEDIHRYTQIYNFALTVEGCSLLAKSSTEMSVALKQQAQKMGETRQLCAAIPDLVVQIDASMVQISTIHSLVQGLPGYLEEMDSISKDMSQLKIATKKLESRDDNVERRKIMSWLSPISFEAKQRRLFERHQRGTGE